MGTYQRIDMQKTKMFKGFILGIIFAVGFNQLYGVFEGIVSPESLTDFLLWFSQGAVTVAMLTGIIMIMAGLGKWMWVNFLFILPLPLANVIRIHIGAISGSLIVRDVFLVLGYLVLVTNLVALGCLWFWRDRIWEPDKVYEENKRRQ